VASALRAGDLKSEKDKGKGKKCGTQRIPFLILPFNFFLFDNPKPLLNSETP
jgi:hypothetical protein